MSTTLTQTTTADYAPPRNFAEFLERHPRHVRGYLHRAFNLCDADLEDAIHDVYVHLMSLPPGSVHARHGDRIAAFDPSIVACSQGAFLGYVNFLTRRYMYNRWTMWRKQVAGHSERLTVEPYARPVDLHDRILVDAIVKRAVKFDPLVARVAVAVSMHRSKQAAAMSLGVSTGRVEHCLRVLRKIVSGISLEIRNRPRQAYSTGQPKPKRDRKLERRRRREWERQQRLEQFRTQTRKV